MDFWQKVKKDIEKAWQEGIVAVKDGSRFAARKVDQLTKEGKKRYRVFDLKTDVHREMGELGGLIYGLKDKEKNPLEDRQVKATMKKVDKLKAQIAKLEGAKTAKKAAKKKAKPKAKAKAKAAAKAKTVAGITPSV